MQVRLAAPLQKDSIVDGKGIRTVIWTQGCAHNCPGCQNMETHDFNGGYLVDVEEIKEELRLLTGQDGITLSGGDPAYQAKEVKEIAKYAQSIGLNVWCYTGSLFEDMLKNKDQKELLSYIDVLVDGKFELSLRSLDLYFKGSSNQRIIDVPLSLKQNKVILVSEYQDKKDYNSLNVKDENMYI